VKFFENAKNITKLQENITW